MTAGSTSRPRGELIPQCPQWAERLGAIAQQPLAFRPDFPRLAQRFEAWWAQDVLDRPVFCAGRNTNPSRPITRRLELIDHPDAWLDAKLADMQQIARVGDALPNIRVDFGAACISGMVGGRRVVESDTAWTESFINDDWSNAPDWRIEQDSRLWRALEALTQRAAETGAGRYLVCSPDLGGASDALLGMRGSEPMCLDAIEQPQRITDAMDAMYPAWRQAISRFLGAAIEHGAGTMTWVGLWSNKPYTTLTCDYNFMLGPRQFRDICLEDIARMCRSLDRMVFHLDGPQATRHVDALLEIDELDAIQYTPGAGTPSALAWVDMFRRIQNAGKSVLIMCPSDEVLALCDALQPEGLALCVESCPDPEGLFKALCNHCGCSSKM